MPFRIIRNDITKVEADVIVNTANPYPVIGNGTDSAIYAAAGEKELLAERLKIGEIAPGQAAGEVYHPHGRAGLGGRETRGAGDPVLLL